MNKEDFSTSPALDRVLELLRTGNLDALEAAWVDLIDEPPEAPEVYERVARAYARAKRPPEAALDLCLVGLEALASRESFEPMLGIVSVLARRWPRSAELTQFTLAALRGYHASVDDLEAILASAGFLDGEGPLDEKLRRAQELLRMRPGEVYSHASWGEAIVRRLDLLTDKVWLDFPGQPAKEMTIEGVRKYLTYLEPSHFIARRARQPEMLRTLAQNDPVGLIRLVLESQGGKLRQADLKALLMPVVIAGEEWTGWWTRARRLLRQEPLIDLDEAGGARAEIALRTTPRSVVETAAAEFLAEGVSSAQQAQALRSLASSLSPEGPPPRDLLDRMAARLRSQWEVAREDAAQRLEIALLAEDFRRLLPAGTPDLGSIESAEEAARAVTDYRLLNAIEDGDRAIRGLKLLLRRDGEAGLHRIAEALAEAPLKLAQAMWKELEGGGRREIAAQALEKLLAEPLAHPETYLWAIKSLLEGNWSGLGVEFGVGVIVGDLLRRLEDWRRAMAREAEAEANAVAQRLSSRARALLAARGFNPICRAAEAMTLEQAQRLRRTIQQHPALEAAFKADCDRQLRLTRRDLEEPAAAAAVPQAEELLCTARARWEKSRELQELNAVKIPANSRAIEEARKEGDLRENAGYHAAKEEQKILLQRALQLQEALGSARLIDRSMVNPESVSFGVRCEALNRTTGQVETYTFLGRWEADAERNILSLQAPVARQFLGRRPGEEFELTRPDGSRAVYRIVALANALESGQWDVPNPGGGSPGAAA